RNVVRMPRLTISFSANIRLFEFAATSGSEQLFADQTGACSSSLPIAHDVNCNAVHARALRCSGMHSVAVHIVRNRQGAAACTGLVCKQLFRATGCSELEQSDVCTEGNRQPRHSHNIS